MSAQARSPSSHGQPLAQQRPSQPGGSMPPRMGQPGLMQPQQGQAIYGAGPAPAAYRGPSPMSPVGGRQLVPLQMPMPFLMPHVVRIPGCPEGLEYLCAVDQILVQQQLQVIELLVPYEQPNKYVVKNTMGQFIFLAVEESDLFSRCFCGGRRPFEMKVMDYRNVEVLRFVRPLRCECVCCVCCLQEMQVYAPPGNLIGSIHMLFNPLFPTFSVRDSNHQEVMRVQGPFITSACFNDVVFDIFAKDGATKLGMISKNWTGAFREYFTDIDNFTLVFPMDLDVKVKAVLMGALILIDFLMFETGPGTGGGGDLPGAFFG